MALQSSSLLDRELEEEELVAIQTRPSREPTPQSRPRIEEMFSQILRPQETTAKSLESKLIENTRSLDENTRSLDENTRSPENRKADMAYKQFEQIAEISDLVERISTL